MADIPPSIFPINAKKSKIPTLDLFIWCHINVDTYIVHNLIRVVNSQKKAGNFIIFCQQISFHGWPIQLQIKSSFHIISFIEGFFLYFMEKKIWNRGFSKFPRNWNWKRKRMLGLAWPCLACGRWPFSWKALILHINFPLLSLNRSIRITILP